MSHLHDDTKYLWEHCSSMRNIHLSHDVFKLSGTSQCYTDLTVWSYKRSVWRSSCLCRPLTSARPPDVPLCPSGLRSRSPRGRAALWTLCRCGERPPASPRPGRPSAAPDRDTQQTKHQRIISIKFTLDQQMNQYWKSVLRHTGRNTVTSGSLEVSDSLSAGETWFTVCDPSPKIPPGASASGPRILQVLQRTHNGTSRRVCAMAALFFFFFWCLKAIDSFRGITTTFWPGVWSPVFSINGNIALYLPHVLSPL